jgi:hypothetical protein
VNSASRKRASPTRRSCAAPFCVGQRGLQDPRRGKAYRASDIDVMWLNGFGLPGHRGGLMHWADTIGVAEIYRQIGPGISNTAGAGHPPPLRRLAENCTPLREAKPGRGSAGGFLVLVENRGHCVRGPCRSLFSRKIRSAFQLLHRAGRHRPTCSRRVIIYEYSNYEIGIYRGCHESRDRTQHPVPYLAGPSKITRREVFPAHLLIPRPSLSRRSSQTRPSMWSGMAPTGGPMISAMPARGIRPQRQCGALRIVPGVHPAVAQDRFDRVTLVETAADPDRRPTAPALGQRNRTDRLLGRYRSAAMLPRPASC